MPFEQELATLTGRLRREGRLVAQTVYECGECGERYFGERRCLDCGGFMRRLGLGGRCSECDHPVLIDELLAEDERVFLAIGEGAERWLRAAAASGATRVRAKMAQATELALLFGSSQVDEALRRAADAGRFDEDDLVSILSHGQRSQALHVVRADESFSAQPGTSAWEGFGRRAS